MAPRPTTSSDASAPSGGALVPVATVTSLSERAHGVISKLDAELEEIELLVTQARAEATRHEQKRVQASDKLPALRDPVERADLATQLVTLTRRAAVMEAQVEVLEGKRKALSRYRDELTSLGDGLAAVAAGGLPGRGVSAATGWSTRPRGCRPRCPGSSWAPRRTSAARSRGRCTTDRRNR